MKFSTGLLIGSTIGVAAYGLARQNSDYLHSKKREGQNKINNLQTNIIETKSDIEVIVDTFKNIIPGMVSDLSDSVSDYTEAIQPNILTIKSEIEDINIEVSNLNRQN